MPFSCFLFRRTGILLKFAQNRLEIPLCDKDATLPRRSLHIGSQVQTRGVSALCEVDRGMIQQAGGNGCALTFAFTGESGYTLGFAQRITHSGPHAETRGLPDGAAITTLGPFHTFRKPCVAGYQNGKLCRFWVLAGCAPEERREPAGQRCAHVRRCSEASRPRWAA